MARAEGKNRKQRRRSRTLSDAGRRADWLLTLVPEFAVSVLDTLSAPVLGKRDETMRVKPDSVIVKPLAWALSTLRKHFDDGRALAARLVALHGPRVRLLLHELRDLPDVAACFPSLTDTRGVLTEARRLVRRHGARRAAVMLSRRYGFTVFDVVVNPHADEPALRALLGVAPRREKAGRPKGSMGKGNDLEAWALAEVHDGLNVPREDVLSWLGRDPESTTGEWPNASETADSKWFRRRLRRGLALRTQPSPSIAFHAAYVRDLPEDAKLAYLIRFLSSRA